MKILVCEDQEILLASLEFRLRKNGFTVITAKDGREALTKVEEEHPDLVIADIMMPHFTGLQLVDYVRNDLELDLPVIIISALEEDETVLEAFRLGANDFISKPFKPTELVLRIKKIFQERELAGA